MAKFEKGNDAAVKYDGKYCGEMLDFFRTSSKYPTFERFADNIGVTARTLENWRDKHKKFKHAYERAKNLQKARLIEGGLAGLYDSRVVKLVALNDHGYADKVETDNKVDFKIDMNAALDEEAG